MRILGFTRAITAVSVPWTGFVGAFLYYVVLTLLAIGVDQLSDVFMAAAYGAPVALYGLVLVARAVRALAALPLPIGHGVRPRHA